MATFTYNALDTAGRSRHGTLKAEDRRSAARLLAAQGLRVLSLVAGESEADSANDSAADSAEKSSGRSADSSASVLDDPPPKKLSRRRLFGAHKAARDFVDSFYQLHANGLPMGDAVKLLGQRVSDPSLRYLCQSLWRDMSEGATLAGAMGRFPAVFDSSTLYLVEAGEGTGNLVPVLKKILNSQELQENLRSKVLSSIGYPAGVCSLAIGVLCLFVFFLMPRLEKIMKSLRGEYPAPVKILMGISDFLVKGGPFIAVALALVVVAVVRWRKSDAGRLKSDRLLLNTPVLGKVVLHTETVRMTDLLATLMSSGINASDALRLCERPVENRVLRQRLFAGRQMINDGAAFASAFKRHSILPIADIDFLTVGENTGSLADTFATIAKRHVVALDKAIGILIKTVTGVVFGSTVGLVLLCVLSIVMTILSVSGNVTKR
ncbi:MAG: type II secretion system F family protein [Puniceicoccales bacterium]|jgi:type II secretory pathway component PulF|nr:type II secretion system F family protein [Puniceicoccales bacterium]